MLYLVRHAKAGSRSEWVGDDRPRPLTGKGQAQAELLADLLGPAATGELVSSPYLRCMQTLAPLAERVGREVRADERLAEDTGFEGALALLTELPDGSVLCSHGDVIPATIGALQRRGCAIVTEPDWRKASTWVITRDDAGEFTEAAALPPPGD
jgi:phosphohistidine phosphatase SixA